MKPSVSTTRAVRAEVFCSALEGIKGEGLDNVGLWGTLMVKDFESF